MKIAGVYLAGGNSKRMKIEGSKLALPVGKARLGNIALTTILQSSLEEIFIVVQQSDAIQWLPPEMKTHSKVTLVTCPKAQLGQANSLHCGIKKAQQIKADAVIIFLADQPFITIQMIEQMIASIKKSPESRFVATTYKGVISPPVLFTNHVFPSLLEIDGDYGAKMLFTKEFLKLGKCLPCQDQRILFDVDTQEDFQHLLACQQQIIEKSN